MSTAESNPLHVPRRHSTGFRIRSRVQPFPPPTANGQCGRRALAGPFFLCPAKKRLGRISSTCPRYSSRSAEGNPLPLSPLCHRLTAHFQLLRQLLLRESPGLPLLPDQVPQRCLLRFFSSAITIHLQYMFSLPVYRLGTTFYKQPAPQKLVAQYLIRHFLAACWPFKPDAASSMAKRAISHTRCSVAGFRSSLPADRQRSCYRT